MDKKCPHCNRPMPKGSSFCMYCFRNVNKLKEPDINQSRRNIRPALTVLVAVVLIAITAGSITIAAKSYDSDKTEAQSTAQAATVTEAATQSVSYTETTTEKATSSTTATEKATATTTEKTSEEATSETVEDVVTQSEKALTKKITRKVTTATVSNKVIISSGVLKKYPASKNSASYTIPYDVKKISDNAFEVNRNLKTLKFSKRENLDCNWDKLFSALPNLKTIYIYPGTSADTRGMQYFDGEIIYYYD